jgi:Amt family ammonium transporter
MDTLQFNLDIIWIIISAALVLFMQAGFTALESGLTRAKNTINVAVKNITDFILSVLIFWAVGFALMFGADVGGWIGSSGFALSGLTAPMDYATFVFQATFAGTAATIVSGAVAERIKFLAYAVVSIVVTGLIYPVSGHWIWGDGGWLAELGMVDFAGSTVVHSLGGWVGLAGALVLGPRLGRFNKDGRVNKIPGHSLVLAVVGVLVLWFGWFGFNGGSTLSADASVARIVTNTLLSAAAGGVSCFILSLILSDGEIHIEKLLNGVIGGLVGITAGCAVVEPAAAVFIGLSAGIVAYSAEWFLAHILKVDDPVNVVSAHGFCGVWGTLILAFAAPESALPTGHMWQQFGVQLLGAGAVFVWGFSTGLLLFWVLRGMDFLRVSPEAEHKGLNVHEHGASSGIIEVMEVMRNIATAQQAGDGDLTRRVPVEIGSEAGELAFIFNQFLDNYQATIARIKKDSEQFYSEATILSEACHNMRNSAEEQSEQIEEAAAAIREMAAATYSIADDAEKMAAQAHNATQETDKGKDVVIQSLSAFNQVASEVEGAAKVVMLLGESAKEVESILQTIHAIANRTDILSLNAAIEAEHADDRGQGLKVVANEVRSLAHKTQESAQEIEIILKHFQRRVSDAMHAIETSRDKARASAEQTALASHSLAAITAAVVSIADMIARIAEASKEEGEVAANMTQNLERISGITQTTSDSAKDAQARSDNVAQLAWQVQQLMACFQIDNTAASKT